MSKDDAALSRWDPFAEIAWRPGARAGAANDGSWFAPAIDIFEDEAAVLVKVELPGVRPEDVVIDTSGRVLTVRGERRLENAERRKGYHRLERAYGAFARSFTLPESVDGPSAVAVMADGVLTIRIPKVPFDGSGSPVPRRVLSRAS